MTALALIITDAGRQAIVDETNAVTLPVSITEIAYGDGTWVPDETATALNNEVKRITELGSNSAAAPDTISLTATDVSADSYTVREIGLYTDTGVLFAIYAQSDPILTKAVDAASLATFDLVFDTVPAGSVTVGDTSFDYPPATTDALGVIKLSTLALMLLGVATDLVPTVDVVADYVTARVFEPGTTMLFVQASAPTGWTKSTDHDNKALRIVSGDGGEFGGSVDFSTAFASKSVSGSITNTVAGGSIVVDNKTLTTSLTPAHTHVYTRYTNITDNIDASGGGNGFWRYTGNQNTSSIGGGGAHNHGGSFNGLAHGHTLNGTAINMAVKYVDSIIAVKD